MSSRRASAPGHLEPDPVLGLMAAILLAGGLVMLTSASMAIGERLEGAPFHFLRQQLVAVILGLAALALAMRVPTGFWQRVSPAAAPLGLILLALVFVPGLGNEVNGSTRWLAIGGVNVMQVSEPARLLLLMYISGYVVRRRDALRGSLTGFIKPMAVIALAGLLLLLEPDFGATVVLFAVAMAVLLVAGARWRDFLLLTVAGAASLGFLAVVSPYRWSRITSFQNPWADPFDSGFQLSQSLIAIGTGEITGVGLGGSVQKLFYLPEAHTDFLFAVIAEEFGLVGSILVILLFAGLVWRAIAISRRSAELGLSFQACLAFGFAVWLGAQAFINIGVNMGILPTKGLTLPLVSYGRSSLIVTLFGLGLLFRIDMENRQPGRRDGRQKTRGGRR